MVSVLTRAGAAVATTRARVTLQTLAKATKAAAATTARSESRTRSPRSQDPRPQTPPTPTETVKPITPVQTPETIEQAPIGGWRRGQRSVRAPRAPRVLSREISVAKQTYQGHSDWVLNLGMAQAGTEVISASQDKSVRVFDVASGVCRRTLEGDIIFPSKIKSRISPIFYIKNHNANGVCRRTGHTNSVLALCVAADEKTILTGSLDGTVKQWELATGEVLLSALCHPKGVLALTIIDEVTFVTGSRDDTAVSVPSPGSLPPCHALPLSDHRNARSGGPVEH